jgi:PAS domain S-box-containing protein
MPNPTQDILWLRNRAQASTNISIVIVDARKPDLPIIDVNPAFVRLTGYTRDEALGLNCRFLQGPRSDRDTARIMAEAIRNEEECSVVILNYRKDGHTFWNEINISPVISQSGTLTHFVAAQMDVTARIRHDDRRQLLSDVDRLLINRVDPSEVIGPTVERIVTDNAEACAIHLFDEAGERTRRAVATSTFLDADPRSRDALLDLMDSDEPPQFVTDCIKSGESTTTLHHQIFTDENKNGVHASFGIVVVPIVGPSHMFGAITLVTNDALRVLDRADEEFAYELGHRLGNHFEMGRLYADLQAAVDVRDEFLSIAAHELRTPISSVKGYSQLLLRGLERGTLLPERLRLGLKTIETSASRLSTLTTDLLEVSRNGLNRLPLHLESVSAYEFVTGFLEERRTLTDTHEFVLKSPDPELWIEADVGRLDQVMANISSNAMKYSDSEHPVELELTSEDGGVAIRIRDRGMGLEPDDQERIFQPFQRSATAISSNIPGMGLGLFISRNIVERHGGSLTAESEGPGTGTTFKVWLPKVIPHPPPS